MELITEFEFELPRGYVDENGEVHKKGVMRLATAADEILPLRDPRVVSNPAYLTIILLSRVVTSLGTLTNIRPTTIEKFIGFLYFSPQAGQTQVSMRSSKELMV